MRKSSLFTLLSAATLCMAGFAAAVGTDSTAGVSAAAVSQYPERPIRLVVTFPPGGGTDLLARKLADKMQVALGQPVVVENRAGASGNIGAQEVAQSAPDGYTLLVVNSSYAINPGVYRELGFSPKNDLVGVINVAYVPSVMVTAADSRWVSLEQIRAASERQSAPAYSSCGNGTPQHLAGEMLSRRAGAQWLHVPYKGCGPALKGVLAREVDFGFVTASSALPLVQAGKLRALAVTSPQRSPLLPDVATVAEQGWAGYQLDQWHGLLAPTGTPVEVIERLNSAVAAIVRTPDMAHDLRAMGFNATASTAAGFQEIIQRDIVRFGALTRQMGLRVD